MLKQAAGNALLDLSLILPFIILVMLSAFEMYKAFQNFQYMSVVVREIGNSVYRDCILRDNDGTPAGTTRMSDCAAPYVNKLLQFTANSAQVLPGAVVIVRVYRVTPPPTAPILAGGFNTAGSGGKVSKYTNAIVTGLRSYIPAKGTIVTTEIFFSAPSLISFFTGDLYETSVF